jgi:soluble lytic murein transglycosylase
MEIDNLLEMDLSETLKRPNHIKEKEFKAWVVLNLLGLLNQKGYYLNTFKLAFDSIDKNYLYFSLPTLKTLFPMSYFSKIKEIESGVDPIITLSLIRQESAFNPKARSIAGATGLMQIMPTTAKTINSKIKKNQLNNPDINLTLGILYLERLLKKYEGDLIFTLSAYNAGEKRLESWLKDYFLNKDPVILVESIPFEETRNYVKLIYRNIFFYKYLSNDPTLFLPVEASFNVRATN